MASHKLKGLQSARFLARNEKMLYFRLTFKQLNS